MNIYDIIERKRDCFELSKEEIEYFINGYNIGNIKDYQISALLMAIFLNGMTHDEIYNMTLSMVNSGEKLSFKNVKGFIVDKHSTGGVGDTITLILGPMLASAGLVFPKMSGRGLGYTGGTIDKLESIPGYRTNLENEDFINLIKKNRIAISSQTNNLAPVDGKIYALRDVTATVDSLPLIVSSVMSKKLSIDSDCIILDIKVGKGAFMKTIPEAEKLASEMVNIAKRLDKKVIAYVTNMNQPLGYAIGNNLEIIEAINSLKGNGPKDIMDLCYEMAIDTLVLAGIYTDKKNAKNRLTNDIKQGNSLKVFRDMVKMQGGDISYILDTSKFPKSKYILEVKSNITGYIASINSKLLGKVALNLGAGRENLDTEIDLTAGIVLNKKIGDRIYKGEALCTIHTNKIETIKDSEILILKSYKIKKEEPNKEKIIFKKIT